MRVKITCVRQTEYKDLSERYEIKQEGPMCSMRVGDVYFSDGEMPEGFCTEAWKTVGPFVRRLLAGETHFFGDWMKDPASAMVSCNDGFRPMSCLVELCDN